MRQLLQPQSPPPWITVYTDASFKAPVAGWGVWARTSDDYLVGYGRCPNDCATSHDAEAYAIMSGLDLALRAWSGAPFSGLTIKSDCQGAVTWFEKRKVDPSFTGRCVARFVELAGDRDIRIRWVKGHQGRRGGAQGAVNGKADAYAAAGRAGRHYLWIKSRGVVVGT